MAGLVAWEGPSRLDGEPIVCIVTGVGDRKVDRTKNTKIGETMIQTWILRQDISPTAAINAGADRSICGDCVLRGILDEKDGHTTNRQRGCYVSVQNAPRQIWMAYTSNKYQPMGDITWKDRPVRLGAYGDPAAIPYRVNRDIVHRGNGKHTGYTHQWRDRRFLPLRKFLMASVQSIDEKIDANRRGWRTFRTLLPSDEPDSDEFLCPASLEQSFRLTCDTCMACSGVGEALTRIQGANVAIYAHGSPATLSGFYKTAGALV